MEPSRGAAQEGERLWEPPAAPAVSRGRARAPQGVLASPGRPQGELAEGRAARRESRRREGREGRGARAAAIARRRARRWARRVAGVRLPERVGARPRQGPFGFTSLRRRPLAVL